MGIDPRKRARQLAKKAAKSAAARKQRARESEDMGRRNSLVANWPVHQSYVPENLFEMGLGNVLISRRMGNQFAVGVFLVDTGCLGVKDAFLKILSGTECENTLDHFEEREPLAPVKPEYARKLIESAVEYALDLGFPAHKDYHLTKVIFGDIDADACETIFEFGKNGKPFYCSCPSETRARREQIINTLAQRFGPEGFKFAVGIGDADDPDEFDAIEE